MKILLTGAHFTTAVAVIEELRKQPNVKIIYVGRKTTMEGDKSPSVESTLLPKLGVEFIPITAGRLQRALGFYTIPSLFKIPIGAVQAFWIIFTQKPDVVLSFGGYVATPVVIGAWLMSIPVIIHEQTLVTGLANRISSWFADKVAVSFDSDHSFNRNKTIITGNPLRREILAVSDDILYKYKRIFQQAQKEELPVILVTGGNQGSHLINQAVEGCLDELLKIACVIHQTGESKFNDYERLKVKENEKYVVDKWIDNMGYFLKQTDLVISRAGINTLSELAYLGTPALVVPIPYIYKDEQNKNAKFFEKLGLVRILPQSKLSSGTLFKSIKSCLSDLNQFSKEAKKAKEIIIKDATKRLVLETILLAKDR